MNLERTAAMLARDAAILRCSEQDRQRFWARVRKGDGCWLFDKGGVKGHGRFRMQGEQVLAHRFAKITEDGAPEGNKLACHRCNVPLCVRPSHLYWGDYSDNLNDRNAVKDIYDVVRGEMHHQARITAEDAKQIFHDYHCGGMRVTALARRHKVNISVVSKLTQGRSWVQITNQLSCKRRAVR